MATNTRTIDTETGQRVLTIEQAAYDVINLRDHVRELRRDLDELLRYVAVEPIAGAIDQHDDGGRVRTLLLRLAAGASRVDDWTEQLEVSVLYHGDSEVPASESGAPRG